MTSPVVLVAHGGAGNVGSGSRDSLRLASLEEVLARGIEALRSGSPALDVVERVVAALEDDAEFNAGVGSVLTSEGAVEMDASIMEGEGRRCGAVAVVTRLRNPIHGARLVLDHSPHVLLVGSGAEAFCFERGAVPIEQDLLVTEPRRRQLDRAREAARIHLDHDGESAGTVGAVALDRSGHLAAATSTGGMTNQHGGRVGDSPIPGAGTWADDNTVAVSSTGDGEAVLRCALAHGIHKRVEHGVSLELACENGLSELGHFGGRGGCIALSARGAAALPFTTEGMYRGIAREREPVRVAAGPDDRV